MFTLLAEEMLEVIPHTPAQLDRYHRAVAECGGYRYLDMSPVYHEAACGVRTLSGKSYIVFKDQCTCPDWTNRCWKNEESPFCKHIIAASITGNLTEPEEEREAPLPLVPSPTGEWGIPDERHLPKELDDTDYDPSDEELTRVSWWWR